MGKCIDLTGERFGRLVVLKRHHKDKHRNFYWLCKCDCGNETVVQSNNLKNRNVKSCGCLGREVHSKRLKTHGLSRTRIYCIWRCMIDRCYNKKNKRYYCYGEKGIRVCDEWRNCFLTFRGWALNNGYREDLTIDRINVNGNYEPTNCRFVDKYTQANNMSCNHKIEYKGETKNMAEWAKIFNINYDVLRCRLRRGWSVEKALTTKLSRKGK